MQYHMQQPLLIDWLCQMRVHSGFFRLSDIIGERICGHGDDGDGGGLGVSGGADGLGGFQSVHLGHHHIHEDGIVMADRSIQESLDSSLAVPGGFHSGTGLGEQVLGNLQI